MQQSLHPGNKISQLARAKLLLLALKLLEKDWQNREEQISGARWIFW
jgi:hypothetical protein